MLKAVLLAGTALFAALPSCGAAREADILAGQSWTWSSDERAKKDGLIRQQLQLGSVRTAWLIGKPAAAAYQGPGDVLAFSAWYGLRAYNATAAANQVAALDLRRASDNATCTAKVATDGMLDLTVGTPCNGNTQTVTAWIGASSALASKVYDQVAGNACGGASCDLIQATAGRQPTLILNCNGSLPCLRSVNGGGGAGSRALLGANNYTPTGTAISMTAVANRASGTQFSFYWISPNGAVTNDNRIAGVSSTNWNTCGTSGCISIAVSNAAWHSATGVINTSPATSVFNVDGSESTSTIPNMGTSAQVPLVQFASASATITTEWAEAGWQNSAAWDSTNRTNVCHNQRLYWSTGGSC